MLLVIAGNGISTQSAGFLAGESKVMPIEIKVTPPGLTMSQGRTFMVTDANGEINPHSSQGVYL